MLYCLNLACSHPQNPEHYQYCQGCGQLLAQTPVFRDRYRVVKFLGEGAFGRTYLVEDLNFKGKRRVINFNNFEMRAWLFWHFPQNLVHIKFAKLCIKSRLG